MDEQRSRIQDDLRGLLDGDVRADEVFLQLYASDASIYEIRPLGVVMPRTTADVVATVQYAAENQIPVHARGAGTGLAGESLGPGLVIDFSKHLRHILRIDESTVCAQPGVVLERLNTQLRPSGRIFGPDPAMSHVTTLGSVVAIDAAGSHWLKYGSARQHVEQLEVVLSDGTLLNLGRESLTGTGSGHLTPNGDGSGPASRRQALIGEVDALLRTNAALIRRKRPQSRVNRSGYQLEGVRGEGTLDFAKLLTGSEGTLALFTEVTVRTQPLPRYRAVALLFFDRLESAARAVLEILPFSPSACDLMDRRHIGLARDTEPRFELMIPAETESLLLVEMQGDDALAVRDGLRRIIDHVRRKKRLAFESRQAFDSEEVELFWQLASKVVPTLYRIRGSTRALPFVEDVAVAPEALPEFLVEMQNVLKRHLVTASLFAHAGHGQLHIRPFIDLAQPDGTRLLRDLATDLYEAVLAAGGTISGEHGDGLSRTPFVPRQYGELYPVFRDVKRIFDPLNILNPGKKVGDEPDLLIRNLRPLPAKPIADALPEAPPDSPLVNLELEWAPGELAEVAATCNGCGSCRAQSPGERMCPIFRFAPGEEASPRAKANLMRGIATGQLDPAALATDELKAVADLCVHCHQCRLECPASVNIPRLMLEAKGAYVASHGLALREWALARIDLASAVGSLLAPLANRMFANRRARWLLEKTLSIAHGRKLPRFASQTFMHRARRRRLTRPTRRTGPKVLYFVDTYANYFDPQVGESLVAVLEHNAVAVYVHPRQRASGMALIAAGAVEAARKLATRNVRLLAEAVRQGYWIVATEPAAALCLTWEYPQLVGDDDARLVAENSSEACAYLWRLHRSGKLALDFKPVNASLDYHLPCHLRALAVGSPGEHLLRLVPGLRVHRVEKGCSGMAGTFGLKRQNYRASLRAGWGLISSVRASAAQLGATECSACKLQMEQGTTKPTIHPLKLLALAYGLLPDVAARLAARSEELTVT